MMNLTREEITTLDVALTSRIAYVRSERKKGNFDDQENAAGQAAYIKELTILHKKLDAFLKKGG